MNCLLHITCLVIALINWGLFLIQGGINIKLGVCNILFGNCNFNDTKFIEI